MIKNSQKIAFFANFKTEFTFTNDGNVDTSRELIFANWLILDFSRKEFLRNWPKFAKINSLNVVICGVKVFKINDYKHQKQKITAKKKPTTNSHSQPKILLTANLTIGLYQSFFQSLKICLPIRFIFITFWFDKKKWNVKPESYLAIVRFFKKQFFKDRR